MDYHTNTFDSHKQYLHPHLTNIVISINKEIIIMKVVCLCIGYNRVAHRDPYSNYDI